MHQVLATIYVRFFYYGIALNAYVLLTTFNKTDEKALRFVRFITAHLPSNMARKSNVVGRVSGILEL